MTEPAPKIKAPTTDVPFLDPGPVSESGVNGSTPAGEATEAHEALSAQETADPAGVRAEPCADCARYAQIGYIAGALVGIAAGGIVAYVILKNRLVP